MKKALISIAIVAVAMTFLVTGGATNLPTTPAAKVDPLLISYLSTRAPNVKVPAVITYRNHPGSAELNRLRSLGILRGLLLNADTASGRDFYIGN